ncbi:MAG: ATP cone domain-containing protein [bacterium]|nr:ATP cone domain-containing protein [bacterium]
MLEKLPLTLLKLRDGRLVPYEKERVAAQVTAAAQAVGMEDPLWPSEVAEAVTLFLRRRTATGVPTEEQLEDAVVKILLRTGHVDMAKAYVLYRSQRRLEEAQVFDHRLTTHQLDLLETNERSILVRDLSGELFPWSRQGRISAIVISSGLDPSIAEQLVLEVEKMLREAKLFPVPLSVILSLHALKLIELGVGSYADIDPVAVPAQLVRSALIQGRAEDRVPPVAVETSGGYIVGQYAVSNVYPKSVRYDHYHGNLQIRSPQMVNRFLSAGWSPEVGPDIGLGSYSSERLLELMRLPDRLAPYFSRMELPRFDLLLARLGAGSGMVDLDVAAQLGLRFWPTSTERLVIGLGVGLDSSSDLATYSLTVAGLVDRMDRRVELAVEVGDSSDDGFVAKLVEASGRACLRFTRPREPKAEPVGVLHGPVASRVAINLRRVSTSGAGKADQLGIEVICHALEAARVKADFLRSVAERRSSGVLGGLVEGLGLDWVSAAAGVAEIELFGLDTAVFELTGGWPSGNPESAKLLGRLARKLVRAAQDFSEKLGLSIVIRAGVDPALEGFFGMLDRAVLGLPEPPPPPLFTLSPDAGHLFRGPYAPAWPDGVSVELWTAPAPESALACIRTALNAGASSVLVRKGGPCTS